MKRTLLSLFLLLVMAAGHAEKQVRVCVSETPVKGSVDLARAVIVISPADELVVQRAARLLAEDVRAVTGRSGTQEGSTVAVQETDIPRGKDVVLAGTLGKDGAIDQLVAEGRLDVSAIRGGWEQYVIRTLRKPMKGVDRALVVAGSDRRGTAYGLLALSEAIGVTPWTWWADVPVEHHPSLYITADGASQRPSVKFRGLFINDEDWGLKPWAAKNYERELGDIGPRTYARVCELILRLRGNMLGPAMHSCTGAFYSHPESKLVADSFGIVITTSHCEPLLVNTAAKTEWDLSRDGDWNYKTNPEGLRRKWNERLREASRFENVYTLAMRGLHDARLRGNFSRQERVELISQLILDQRELLVSHKGCRAEEIPQILVPYKETMDIYEDGLRVPDDVTLVWVDDNYGYMKRVSNPEEQRRSGGAGVYYHISYLGAPHDYLWLCTTPPVLMYEELRKAYDTGADRYWLLNVGDIKPAELGLQTFFDMAWDIDGFGYERAHTHQAEWLSRVFDGPVSLFQGILDEYYRLAWMRKPECMGWEREWVKGYPEHIIDTDFSFQNYGEAQLRLVQYKALSDRVDSLERALPEARRAAFFELLGYPVRGAYQMNRKFLLAQFNHELAAQGDTVRAEWAARQSQLAYDSIRSLTLTYNEMLGGKWRGMMALAPGLRSHFHEMPPLVVKDAVGTLPPAAGEEALPCPPCQSLYDSLYVLPLADTLCTAGTDGRRVRLIRGLGYDWQVVQLGTPTAAPADPTNLQGPRVEYALPRIEADTVTLELHTVPFWPIFKGRGTRIGLSIDDSPAQVYDNKFREQSPEWNDQVLQNGDVARFRFALDKSLPSHRLALLCGDPGMMVEKVIVDWGGLRKSYLGPLPSTLQP